MDAQELEECSQTTTLDNFGRINLLKKIHSNVEVVILNSFFLLHFPTSSLYCLKAVTLSSTASIPKGTSLSFCMTCEKDIKLNCKWFELRNSSCQCSLNTNEARLSLKPSVVGNRGCRLNNLNGGHHQCYLTWMVASYA